MPPAASDPTVTRRARPLPPQQRRQALIDAALRLIREHHRLPTTREIAQEAQVAEGTIFGVFTTKDDLFAAAVDNAFDPTSFHRALAEIDRYADRDRVLLDMVTVLQDRFLEIFDLMGVVGMAGPPERFRDPDKQRADEQESARLIDHLLQPHADTFTVPVEQVARLVRLLTFSGSNTHIGDGQLLTPEEIVRTVLYGVADGPASGR